MVRSDLVIHRMSGTFDQTSTFLSLVALERSSTVGFAGVPESMLAMRMRISHRS